MPIQCGARVTSMTRPVQRRGANVSPKRNGRPDRWQARGGRQHAADARGGEHGAAASRLRYVGGPCPRADHHPAPHRRVRVHDLERAHFAHGIHDGARRQIRRSCPIRSSVGVRPLERCGLELADLQRALHLHLDRAGIAAGDPSRSTSPLRECVPVDLSLPDGDLVHRDRRRLEMAAQSRIRNRACGPLARLGFVPL